MDEDRIADYLAASEDELLLDGIDYDEAADAADFERLLSEES